MFGPLGPQSVDSTTSHLCCLTHRLWQRFGNAITSAGTLNLRHAAYASDFSPIDPECDCVCCRSPSNDAGLGITKAYIHHVAAKETAGAHLYVSYSSQLLNVGQLNLMFDPV